MLMLFHESLIPEMEFKIQLTDLICREELKNVVESSQHLDEMQASHALSPCALLGVPAENGAYLMQPLLNETYQATVQLTTFQSRETPVNARAIASSDRHPNAPKSRDHSTNTS